MTTATEKAKIIRAELKAQGISNRKVSVRAEYFSMGQAIRVEIKDPAVEIATVKAIAEPHEKIDRCELTGDILAGGNTYLTVEYSPEANEARAEQYVEPTREAFEAAKADPSSCVQIKGTHVEVSFSHGSYQLWNGDTPGMHVSTVECAARVVADYVGAAAEEDAKTESEYEAKLAADEDAHDEQLDAAEEARDFDAYPALRLLP